jgi:Zn-finger nucleic acid-binding protein
MNFISEMEGQEIHVELKYCERCGGLWLRPQGAGGVYCAACRARLAAMPDPGEPSPRAVRRRNARLPRRIQQDDRGGDIQGQARIDYLQGVAAMEVRA